MLVVCVIYYVLCLNVTVLWTSWSKLACERDFRLNITALVNKQIKIKSQIAGIHNVVFFPLNARLVCLI